MRKRITVRLSDELFARLLDRVKGGETDVSRVIRQVLTAHLNETPSPGNTDADRGVEITPHGPEDCIQTLLAQCVPGGAARLAAIAQQFDRPLPEVVGELVTQGLRMKWWWGFQRPGSQPTDNPADTGS
jgi:hypothetical protein